jgi:hypothetical protein
LSQENKEDDPLEEALRGQRELLDLYKRVAKNAPEGECKDLFKRLRKGLEDQVEQVAKELARHRMERRLGRPIDQS